MSKAILIYTNYATIDTAVMRDGKILTSASVDKKNACRELIAIMDHVLSKSNTHLAEVTYGAALVGPGPFTTLRIGLATINGLAFAHKLPLIAVNGFDAFIAQYRAQVTTPYLVVLLNAFCQDVYYAIHSIQDNTTDSGYAHITSFIERAKHLKKHAPLITIIGNGASIYQEQLKSALADQVYLPSGLPQEPSLSSIALQANELYRLGQTQQNLLPLYLKPSSAHLGKTIPT